jgi:integrase
LKLWAQQFPNREPEHCVFPAERYGASGDVFETTAYATDPTKPIASIKEAWESAKERAGLKCRFHDLKHTAVSRMLDAGVPIAKDSQDRWMVPGNDGPHERSLWALQP